jgi:hypothetical protein
MKTTRLRRRKILHRVTMMPMLNIKVTCIFFLVEYFVSKLKSCMSGVARLTRSTTMLTIACAQVHAFRSRQWPSISCWLKSHEYLIGMHYKISYTSRVRRKRILLLLAHGTEYVLSIICSQYNINHASLDPATQLRSRRRLRGPSLHGVRANLFLFVFLIHVLVSY